MAAPSASLLAWLRPEQINVAFAGASWRLEARTAADWLGAIAMDFDTLSGVFPGLVAEEDVEAMLKLSRDPSHFQGMQEVAQKVVQAAGGRDWWWSVNLARRTVGNWILINGFLVRQGVRSESTSFPDWLDACYSWLWERAGEDDRIKLDMELSFTPRGVRASKQQERDMLAAFQAD